MAKLTPAEWRRAKNLSIVDVAKHLGVSHMTWAKWEAKPDLIPIGLTYKFCDLVGAEHDQVSFLP